MIAPKISVDMAGALRKLDVEGWRAASRVGLYAALDVVEQESQQLAQERIYGEPSPSYKRTGDYMTSLTKGGRNHIRRVIWDTAIQVGTSIRYARFLEYGTRYISSKRILEDASTRAAQAMAAAYETSVRRILGNDFGGL